MGIQLIFVVEADKRNKSDWIYIKDTIEHFYQYDRSHVKFSPVYMGGKGNYAAKEREISRLISEYHSGSKENHSYVFYCFDCDDYDRSAENQNFLNEVRQYCKNHRYEFIWFCRDIEQVYLGKKVDDSRKKEEAAAFKKKKKIREIDSDRLSGGTYRLNTSNILSVLDAHMQRAAK